MRWFIMQIFQGKEQIMVFDKVTPGEEEFQWHNKCQKVSEF